MQEFIKDDLQLILSKQINESESNVLSKQIIGKQGEFGSYLQTIYIEPSCTIQLEKYTDEVLQGELTKLYEEYTKHSQMDISCHAKYCKNEDCMYNPKKVYTEYLINLTKE